MVKKKIIKKKKVITMPKEKEKPIEPKEEDKNEGLSEEQIANLKRHEEADK